jgi:hypothetical protein
MHIQYQTNYYAVLIAQLIQRSLIHRSTEEENTSLQKQHHYQHNENTHVFKIKTARILTACCRE